MPYIVHTNTDLEIAGTGLAVSDSWRQRWENGLNFMDRDGWSLVHTVRLVGDVGSATHVFIFHKDA